MKAANKATKKKAQRIQLLNHCYCSQFTVYPSNWDKPGANPDCIWYINYRFYDPAHPKPKQIVVKGMNYFTTLQDKRKSVQDLLEIERERIVDQHYNPITGEYMKAPEPEPEPIPQRTTPILPEDGLWRGIIFARTNKKYADATCKDVDSYLKRFLRAAREMRIHTKPLGEFRRRDLLAIIEHLRKEKEWSPHTFNHFIGYLGGIFQLLNVWEAMEVNPAHGIEKMELPETIRTVLTDEERRIVNEHLRDNHHRFWLFIQIFFHSGSRIIELLQVKREDVEIETQRFWVTTCKGKKKLPRRVPKPIKDIALPYWVEYLEGAGDGQYLFCKGWKVANRALTRDWVTHLWEKIVKDGLGIDVDLYSLKHLNYDEIDEQLGAEAAAAQAGHTSTRMAKHYAVTKKDRELKKVQKLQNAFAS